MDHRQVGKYWDENAEAWTLLVQQGFDVYRNYLNTPAFFDNLPDVTGLRGLDLGCGEGYNTRLLAQRGANVTALDIAYRFLRKAHDMETSRPLGISYINASAVELPFPSDRFDFVTGFMSFMDIPETTRLIQEVYRVIQPGGFLQFNITHPCFDTSTRINLRDESGKTYAIGVGDYFRNQDGEVTEWLFSAAPTEAKEGLKPFRTPRFTRTLSQWLNLLLETGFILEKVAEPYPDDITVAAHPYLQDAQVVAYFLHIRVRKP